MIVADTLRAFWIIAVFLATFLWLPTHLSSSRSNSPMVLRIAGNGVRGMLCVAISVFVLSSLRVFGAVTVVLLFLGMPVYGWFRKRAGVPRHGLARLQEIALNIIRRIESRSFSKFLLA